MPMDCPWYRPEPKSACNGVVDPMKLMIASEFGSSGALAMFVFQRPLDGKGMNPFKLAPCPKLIRLQGLICADARLAMNKRIAIGNREVRDLRCIWFSWIDFLQQAGVATAEHSTAGADLQFEFGEECTRVIGRQGTDGFPVLAFFWLGWAL